ncbi:MAG: sulfur-carrier protein [Clostridia bacterium]|nr:sulfur-carrier protein [Clostridia bacterium]MDN5323552.1 sulfur-carrier protein [Clostridia bacterium]
MSYLQIEVRLFAHLRQKTPNGPLKLNLEEGSTVQDLLNILKLTEEQSLIIMVNGKREYYETILNNGDRVGIFPPVGGG